MIGTTVEAVLELSCCLNALQAAACILTLAFLVHYVGAVALGRAAKGL